MEYSGSYRRFGAGDSMPSLRPHNKHLADALVDEIHLTTHTRNVPKREENKTELAHLPHLKTDYGREGNLALDDTGGNLSNRGSFSKTHSGEKDYTTKKGDKDFHRGEHDERKGGSFSQMMRAMGGGGLAFHGLGGLGGSLGRGMGAKGEHFKVGDKHSASTTRLGRQDFVTHKGDALYNRNGKRETNRGVSRNGDLKGGDFWDVAGAVLPFLL